MASNLSRVAPALRALAVTAAFALASPALRAADPTPAATPTRVGFVGDILAVTPAAGEITIDGRMDEPAWDAAARVDLVFETRPGENIAPPVATEVRITHDAGRILVGFRASDPDPAAIRAHLLDRDTAFNDDFVGIVIDTFNDERRGFEFFVNPLGVQMDLFMDDVNGNEDTAWDAIWSSAGRITDSGYEVEIAVPFSSLRFPRSEAAQTWGFDALRFYPRSDRHRIASQPMLRERSCYLCQISKMSGFAGITPGRNIELAPTVTGSRTDEQLTAGEGLTEGDGDGEAGLTVRWGVTPNLTLNGALNPDFSQVETDAAQLDVNTQFALFYPEKRPFFLEGADFFDTPIDAVFTRNVADPDWGVKLTGKEGANGIGVFVAEDTVTNLLLPGPEGSSAVTLPGDSTDAVLRYRRDLGDGSALGGLFTDRDGVDYHNQLIGADGRWRMTDVDTLNVQALHSETQYPRTLVADGTVASDDMSDQAFHLYYVHDARDWWWNVRYDDLGDGFRADLGFVPQVGYRKAIVGGQRILWGETGKSWYNTIWLGGDFDRTEDRDGTLLEEEWEAWWEFEAGRQSYVSFDGGVRERTYQGRSFEDWFLNVFGKIQPTSGLYLELNSKLGETIDFANVRPARIVELAPLARWDFGRGVRLSLNHTVQRLEVAEGELYTAGLTRLRLVVQLNLRSFVRLVTQYSDIDRDPGLYVDPVEATSRQLANQLLFSYKLNPQTVLFVGYSDGYAEDLDARLTQGSRTLFVKLGYALVL